MPNMNCCVCGASLAQYDEVAANFHLNACLDSGGSTAAARSASSSREPDSSGLAFLARTEVPQCPLCEKELPAEELQDHVDACLIAHEENGQSRQANDTVGVTQDGLFDDAAEVCPSCLLEWNAIDVPRQDRELHVADCLSQAQALREDDDDDSDEAMTESRLQATIEKFKSKSNGFGKLRGAWKGEGKHTSVTPGIIPVLQALLEKSSSTRLAVLCTAKVEHIKSQFGDFGWGCGYKSACMVYSALRHVDQYRDLLREELNTESDSKDAQGSTRSEKRRADGLTSREDVADIPSIGELQQIAEVAWEAGFDEEGRKHFQGKLVGSRRWIGTSEVYTMFTWLGIRTTVIDFPKVEGSAGAHTVLAKWVFDYFKTPIDVSSESKDAFGKLMGSKGQSVKICEDRMPLYLQHQGHSRVVVGVEQTKAGELNLLVFDCGKKIAPKLKEAASVSSSKRVKYDSDVSTSRPTDRASLPPKFLEPYRVNLSSLSKKNEYQILRIETSGGALTAREKLARREITSLRVT